MILVQFTVLMATHEELSVLKGQLERLGRDVDRLCIERTYERARGALLEKKCTNQWTLDDELRLTLIELHLPHDVITMIVGYNHTVWPGLQRDGCITRGDMYDVLDSERRWVHAEIIDYTPLPPVACEEGARLARHHVWVMFHFMDWNTKWDEWILLSSDRVKQYSSKVAAHVFTGHCGELTVATVFTRQQQP